MEKMTREVVQVNLSKEIYTGRQGRQREKLVREVKHVEEIGKERCGNEVSVML
jgi:hypothetical protein